MMIVFQFIKLNSLNETLNSDGELHQYPRNEQSPLTSNLWT